LVELPQVQGAWLFSAYARSLAGGAGHAYRDVAVAVLVKTGTGAETGAEVVYQACAHVGAALRLEVSATVFTSDEWASTEDVFVRQFREGVLMDLLDVQIEAVQ
jgi:hypothetical protein